MSPETLDTTMAASSQPGAETLSSPAGLQANATLARRRAAFLTLTAVTWAGLVAWMALILSAGGWSLLDAVILVCFVFGTPWAVLGFWTAVFGYVLLHGGRDALAKVAPFLNASGVAAPLTQTTAVLMTLRNEDPVRAVARLRIVKDSLERTGEGARFSYFLLSDTDRAAIAGAEERAVAAWRADDPTLRLVYRRRASNDGFKAGNVRDFCLTYGRDFDLMLPLDADSLMTGEAIVGLARIMEAHPKIGILQSLVVGTPSGSPFARIFQFGMRLGMRSYTMGQAWWVGDCGPFWGHNALVRIKPFAEHCDLPVLAGSPPLGGPILSHDQVEAVLMRRAGYEVRVMPIEGGSYEDNPPDALEFIRRDVRWCQGNMQYLKLLGMEGVKPISRFQLLWAILMFVGIPAWTVMIAVLPLATLDALAIADFPVVSAQLLYLTFLGMYLSPKIAGFLDVLTTPGEAVRFGGRPRFMANAGLELVFSFLQGAVTTIRTSVFMLGLPFGKSITWSGQQRDAEGLSWRAAADALWPQFLFGLTVLVPLYVIAPAVALWSLPLTAGYLLAIPFAVATASPALGRYMRRHGIAAIPEDFAPPREIAVLEPGKDA